MKTLKIGVILLAFTLTAVVMVPMVSATTAINYSLVSDVSTLPFPQLHFNTSQKYANVTTEFDPDMNIQPSQISNLLAISPNPVVSKIPYGSIIYYSKEGVTTVFDANGNQLFAAEDVKSPKIPTPNGLKWATHVFGMPSGSVITAWGNITYVSYHNVLLFEEIREGVPSTSLERSSMRSALMNDPPLYVEGIFGTPTSSSLGNYITYWNVPSNPQSSVAGEPIFLWNGVQSNGNVPNLGMPVLIQPVLQWNVQSSQWSMASWVIFGDFAGHSDNTTGVSTGDVILGQMSYNPNLNDWTILTRDTSVSGMPTATYDVSNMLPNSNVYTEVYLESYIGSSTENTNMPGGTNFYSFSITDTNLANCAPTSITTDIQSSLFPRLTGLGVTNTAYWPNPSTHPLVLTTYKQ